MLIFPLRQNERILFESIMPIVVTLAVVIFANLYFKNVTADFVKEGVYLGLIFMVVSILIDLNVYARADEDECT